MEEKEPVYNTCPEIPYFGAKYPDARCIDGNLYDMDNCDENGNLYEMNEYNPCPFCDEEAFLQNVIDDEGDVEKAKEWIEQMKIKYS